MARSIEPVCEIKFAHNRVSNHESFGTLDSKIATLSGELKLIVFETSTIT